MEFVKMLTGKKKIVMFGELGSGKTELSINLAAALHKETGQSIRLMDMDQTKPMYRARDIAERLAAEGITLMAEEQFMDAPTVSPGIREKMEDEVYTVMDVGGSFHGALCMGQFAEIIKNVDALVLYVINPYRPFSDTTERIQQTMLGILNCCHLEQVHILSNPFFGENASLEELQEGNAELRQRVAPLGYPITAVAVPAELFAAAERELQEPLIPVKRYLQYVLNPFGMDSEQ